LIEACLAALAGLLIGSFLNVCIYRLPRDLSVIKPRSYCPECDRTIRWYDNIPVLSFLLLKGRCRRCRARIPWRYLAVELLTAAAFFGSFWFLGVSLAAVKFCVLGAILIALVFSDLEERILPDEFTLGGAVLGVVFAFFVHLDWGIVGFLLHNVASQSIVSAGESVFAALFCAGSLWVVGLLYQKIRHREGLGLGDVKMVAMIGAFLGLEAALLALIVASLLGALIGLCYIWFTGKDASTYELPFGSFLGIGALCVSFVMDVIRINRLGA
jgi:leader peptidase (prepilin peptidase) / N-methyltransferase